MKFIDDVLVSDAVFEAQFACNIQACKGACCIEGDLGAPLKGQEVATLQKILPIVRKELNKKSKELIDQKGFVDNSLGQKSTQCHDNGMCVFATRSSEGALQCGIEKAYQKGRIDFQKPISCHLYPLREKRYGDFTALNYHRWDICSAACSQGEKEKISLLAFAQKALERRFGKTWFQKALLLLPKV